MARPRHFVKELDCWLTLAVIRRHLSASRLGVVQSQRLVDYHKRQKRDYERWVRRLLKYLPEGGEARRG